MRWIIELYRLLPGGWVTLQDVYRCTIDAELFAQKIGEARDLVARVSPVRVTVAGSDLVTHQESLEDWAWEPVPGTQKATCRLDPGLRERLGELDIPFETEEGEGGAGSELREQVEAIERWYLHDWTALDAKLRTSIVEGISVFLSLFDQPQVASMFCPPPPDPDESIHMYSAAPDEDGAAGRPMPGLRRRLPPLAELIEGGRVLALNMPAGANPALGRAIGVLLKNAWMQALLRRPAEAARRPGRYLRPAVFICDEYQAFATVGQGRPRWRREGVRADAAVPLHPDRGDAVDLLAPLRAVGHGGLAHAGPDAPHPDLPVALRRVLGQDRLGDVRQRHENAALLHVHRDHGPAGVLAPVGTRRRREGHDRREQVVPAGTGAGVHPPGLHAPRQLSGDLPALRRHEVPAGPARLSEAPLPVAR